MLNAAMLKGKMVEKGISVSDIASKLNINPATFYRKMRNNSFEINEADGIVNILSLTKDEAMAIFFNHDVA